MNQKPRHLKKPELTDLSNTVLRERYLWKDRGDGRPEQPEDLFWRVANAVAEGDTHLSEAFYEIMADLRFLPNTPTLMNAGKRNGQLSACFVLPIEDHLESIFNTLRDSAIIHQSGGGTGFSFSRIRAKGSEVSGSKGTAAGPIAFLKIFDQVTETIKQGGARRGANMGILRVDHPDILEFIRLKRNQTQMVNFNLSVGITDQFMTAVKTNMDFTLIDPYDPSYKKKVNASWLFEEMVRCAWEVGDPGLIFLDEINRRHPTPQVGEIESTNPCGEQPLLPYESCNLGSINVSKYFQKKGKFNWGQFRTDIELAVEFLDRVISVNHFPLEACQKITLANRKIGLGIMGFADLLLLNEIPYDSDLARKYGFDLMEFLEKEGKKASEKLGKLWGVFPNYSGSRLEKNKEYPRRNATVTTIAPTGSLSLIAGCSSGIEPIYSIGIRRNILDQGNYMDIQLSIQRLLNLDKNQLKQKDILQTIHDQLLNDYSDSFRTAHKVSVFDHIQMQAVFQKHSDSAVSKTINLPNNAGVETVREAYWEAYLQHCKGITVYRDGSRGQQVLEAVHCNEC